MSPTPLPSLDQLLFTAGIDYLSLTGITKAKLPALDGKVVWPRSAPGRLTVHDCTPADVRLLASLFPKARIFELEVFIDVRTSQDLSHAEQEAILKAFKAEYVAKRLKPEFDEGTNSGFRGAYHPDLHKTIPFNKRVPGVNEQHLYGHRNDGVQTKCYFKKTDFNNDLAWKQHRVRTEVRLGQIGLETHALTCLDDLLKFKFRKQLMRYFTHVSGSRRSLKGAKSKDMLRVLRKKLDESDRTHWEKVGIGAFLLGGKMAHTECVFIKDTEMNNRIGQALTRLERAVSKGKFVRKTRPRRAECRGFMRLPASKVKSCMTYLTA